MKKILLTIIITIGFMQADEWIYFNNMTDYEWGVGADYSVTRISPDGSVSEIILEDAQYSDISDDGQKLLITDYILGKVYIYNTLTMDTLNFIDNIFSLSKAKFTNEENIIIYSVSDEYAIGGAHKKLYKHSFTNNLSTLLGDQLSPVFDNMTFSPDGHEVINFKLTQDENTEDSFMNIDIIITNIESSESTLLTTIPYYDFSGSIFFNNNAYWSDNGSIYLSFLDDNQCIQLFAIDEVTGYITQLTDNPCPGMTAYCIPSILEIKGSNSDRFVYTVCNASSSEQWIYDIALNNSSYLGYWGSENYVSLSFYQEWSPDHTKVAITEQIIGGWAILPGPIRIYNIIDESINILGDFDIGAGAEYSASSPLNWVEEGLAGDVNDDALVNVLDIVSMVNIVLNGGDYYPLADLNGDGIVNVLDIVVLVNIILEQ